MDNMKALSKPQNTSGIWSTNFTTKERRSSYCGLKENDQDKQFDEHDPTVKSGRGAMTCVLFFTGMCLGFGLFPLFLTFLSYHHANRYAKKSSDMRTPDPSEIVSRSSKFVPVKFSDVAGMDEAKYELTEIVQFFRTPKHFTRLGARMPKGVLLIGPPGSGKTMLARAVATEAQVPYLYTSGSEFIEIYIGQGARRIRELFSYARSKAPCIVFIDELDAVGARRQNGMGSSGGHREHDQTLNQLLVELDGFTSSSGIVVLGATNRLDVLDSALLRPGRFDRVIHVPLPNLHGRELILKKYLKKVKHSSKDLDLIQLSRITAGFSGADLENLINEAAILAARQNKEEVTVDDILEARDKVSIGPTSRSKVMTEEQRTLTAYHESGHAIVAYFLLPHADPIHKATIISRGTALGFVEQTPPDHRYGHAKVQLKARLAVSMGGRVAEEIVFGPNAVSNGASSDIEMATALAYRMVTEWGMATSLPPVNYANGYANKHGIVSAISDKSARLVEKDVAALVTEAYSTAYKIIRKNRKMLDLLAKALLEKETLSGEDVAKIIKDYQAARKRFFGLF